MKPAGSPDMSSPERYQPFEPLDDSALLAWDRAPQLCRPECLSYHRVWQYLRRLGIITSIRTNTDFLLQVFRRVADEHPRVLVSGTADYGMLAHLHDAYGARPLDVTVLDLCATPLMLNGWFGRRVGRAVRLVQHDAATFTHDVPFDLIVTHNFLGRFAPAGRRALIANWARLLRSGGIVVTTQRVRPRGREGESSYRPAEVDAVVARVAAAAAVAGLVNPGPEALAVEVREYARRKTAATIVSIGEVTDVFESCGLVVDQADAGGGSEERVRDRPASSVDVEAFRMRLVARKP